jgi:hypothetical protein
MSDIVDVPSVNVKRVASCLWSSIEQLAFPFDAAKRVQVTMWSADEVTSDDCIQLGCCPQVATLLRYPQLVA